MHGSIARGIHLNTGLELCHGVESQGEGESLVQSPSCIPDFGDQIDRPPPRLAKRQQLSGAARFERGRRDDTTKLHGRLSDR